MTVPNCRLTQRWELSPSGTGQGARRTTCSATLPIRNRPNPILHVGVDHLQADGDQLTTCFLRHPANLCGRIAFFQPALGGEVLSRNLHPVQILRQILLETSLLRRQRGVHAVPIPVRLWFAYLIPWSLPQSAPAKIGGSGCFLIFSSLRSQKHNTGSVLTTGHERTVGALFAKEP